MRISGKTVLDREWSFNSASTVSFTIVDSLNAHIHFPGEIPDDRLIGYCRFHITISDSNPGSRISGKSFMYYIQFDCGFNNFDHKLTLELDYTKGLFSNNRTDQYDYSAYIDPYPVSKIHQWIAVSPSNYTVDTTVKLLRIVYDHKISKRIATTGYPFDYGLFSTDSTLSVNYPDKREKINSYKSVHFFFLEKYIYRLNGQRTGFNEYRDTFPVGSGCYLIKTNRSDFRKGMKCTILKK